MNRRTLGAWVLAVWIGAAAPPAATAAGDQTPRPAGQGAIAQMESSSDAGERPLEIEKQKMRSRFRYLMLGYGLIWISLGAYLLQMNRRVAQVGREIDELKGRVDDLKGPGRTTAR